MTRRGVEVVAVVLAVGIVSAINFVTIAVLYDAIRSQGPGLSDNATQVLTTAFGGIIGLLGAFVGYRVGAASNNQGEPDRGYDHPAELDPGDY